MDKYLEICLSVSMPLGSNSEYIQGQTRLIIIQDTIQLSKGQEAWNILLQNIHMKKLNEFFTWNMIWLKLGKPKIFCMEYDMFQTTNIGINIKK